MYIKLRLLLPNIYEDISQRGDVILGITTDNYPEASVCDILSIDGFTLIKADLSYERLNEYKISDGGYLYVVTINGETKIYDRDFKLLENIPLVFDNTEKLINALKKKYNISIDDDSVIQTLVAMKSI